MVVPIERMPFFNYFVLFVFLFMLTLYTNVHPKINSYIYFHFFYIIIITRRFPLMILLLVNVFVCVVVYLCNETMGEQKQNANNRKSIIQIQKQLIFRT